ncbi:MAG: hypothetical protein RXR82_00615 [Nitrososphaeria archaeon]
MRPVEPDYQEQCQKLYEGEELPQLLPNLDKEDCVPLLRRGTRRCHRIARQYLLTNALSEYVSEEVKRGTQSLSEHTNEVAVALSFIDVGAYSYSVEGRDMLISIVKGFGPTWRYKEFLHNYTNGRIIVGDEEVEYREEIRIRFHDAVMREWFVVFDVTPGLMTYNQYKRWIPVLRKWQDRALAAVGAATL